MPSFFGSGPSSAILTLLLVHLSMPKQVSNQFWTDWIDCNEYSQKFLHIWFSIHWVISFSLTPCVNLLSFFGYLAFSVPVPVLLLLALILVHVRMPKPVPNQFQTNWTDCKENFLHIWSSIHWAISFPLITSCANLLSFFGYLHFSCCYY